MKPRGVALPPAAERMLDEAVRFEDFASGPARMVYVVSPSPLTVKQVEALEKLFPGASVHSTPFTVEGPR